MQYSNFGIADKTQIFSHTIYILRMHCFLLLFSFGFLNGIWSWIVLPPNGSFWFMSDSFHSYSKKKHVDYEIKVIAGEVYRQKRLTFAKATQELFFFFSSLWMLKNFHRKLYISLKYVRHWPDFLRLVIHSHFSPSRSLLYFAIRFLFESERTMK